MASYRRGLLRQTDLSVGKPPAVVQGVSCVVRSSVVSDIDPTVHWPIGGVGGVDAGGNVAPCSARMV